MFQLDWRSRVALLSFEVNDGAENAYSRHFHQSNQLNQAKVGVKRIVDMVEAAKYSENDVRHGGQERHDEVGYWHRLEKRRG